MGRHKRNYLLEQLLVLSHKVPKRVCIYSRIEIPCDNVISI
jgi:hypothetical protein